MRFHWYRFLRLFQKTVVSTIGETLDGYGREARR